MCDPSSPKRGYAFPKRNIKKSELLLSGYLNLRYDSIQIYKTIPERLYYKHWAIKARYRL
jgi:hypothetical protein